MIEQQGDGQFCGNCHTYLGNGVAKVPNCPVCGSSKSYMNISILEGVGLYESNRSQLKDPSRRSPDKLRVDQFCGAEKRISNGDMVRKVRIVDRDRDLYFESVTDIHSGEVIHQCAEPLSKHLAHGSAKGKGKGRDRS